MNRETGNRPPEPGIDWDRTGGSRVPPAEPGGRAPEGRESMKLLIVNAPRALGGLLRKLLRMG